MSTWVSTYVMEDGTEMTGEQLLLVVCWNMATNIKKSAMPDFPLSEGMETLRETIEIQLDRVPDVQLVSAALRHFGLDEEGTMPDT